jgi:hypothetical protein
MVFEEAEASNKGVKAFIAQTNSLGLNFDKNNWAPSGKRRMKAPREGHHLNKGDQR